MKTFRQYLEESKKVYRFRIKTVVNIHDGMMDHIEGVLARYDAIMVSRPKTTILQAHPLDFPNVPYGEVTIIDVETSLPASSYEMMMNLRAALNIPESFIVVRGEFEPSEIYTRDMAVQPEEGEEPVTLLSTDPSSAENAIPTPDLYGNAYNMSLLRYLRGTETIEKPDGADENTQTVRPIPAWEKGTDTPPADVMPWGNMAPQPKSIIVNRNGKPVVKTGK